MKKILFIILAVLFFLGLVFAIIPNDIQKIFHHSTTPVNTLRGKNTSPAESEDVTGKIEMLGNPYAKYYRDGPSIYARNIWDMKVFNGKLYLGAGNSSNEGPAPNAGPVEVIYFNPKTNTFVSEFSVDEEQINIYQEHNNQLYIPGHDPTESWKLGNFYRKSKGESWKKYRDIPGALHTYDLAWYDGKLFGALGIRHAAAVAISPDNGKSWTVIPVGRNRVYTFLTVAGHLFAAKRVPTRKLIKRWLRRVGIRLYGIAEFKPPGRFISRDDITADELFPGTAPSMINTATKIIRPLQLGNKAIYIGAAIHNDHQSLPFGVFVASSLEKNAIKVEKIGIPDNYQPWDLLIYRNYLYILVGDDQGRQTKIKVLRASIHDLTHCKEIFQFTAETFARSFAIMNGDFYFGLGCEIRNPKRWNLDELKPATGNILRIKKSQLPDM